MAATERKCVPAGARIEQVYVCVVVQCADCVVVQCVLYLRMTWDSGRLEKNFFFFPLLSLFLWSFLICLVRSFENGLILAFSIPQYRL